MKKSKIKLFGINSKDSYVVEAVTNFNKLINF